MTRAAVPLSIFMPQVQIDPLSREHRRELTAARDRARPIRKAARVAAFNGWTTAGIAALSLPFSLLSPIGLALTAGIGFVAYNEFRGRRRLLDFNPRGATLLGWNQIGLLAMVTVYCVYALFSNLQEINNPSGELNQMVNALGLTAKELAEFVRPITIVLYGSVIVLTALFQGGTALYYFTRRRLIEQFIAETPEWVRDVQSGTLPA